jgi:hypothetical protein
VFLEEGDRETYCGFLSDCAATAELEIWGTSLAGNGGPRSVVAKIPRSQNPSWPKSAVARVLCAAKDATERVPPAPERFVHP